jgi:MAC/Perforin domain
MNYVSPIPGSSAIGWGFNIFGLYSSKSLTRQFFAFPDSGKTWSYEYDKDKKIEFLLLDNIIPEEIRKGTGFQEFFSSRSKVEEHFEVKAGLQGSYGGFSGQFEGMYSQASMSDTSYTYGLFGTEFTNWKLAIQNASVDTLADQVRNDPDYMELPDELNDRTLPIFFRFFSKYGTHYVNQVSVGFKLHYSSAVSKSYSTNEKEIKAKLELEYSAVFVKVKAQAETEWKKATMQWAENRESKVEAQGGNSSILDLAMVGYGDNFKDAYDTWRAEAERTPVAIDFSLKPISDIFSGAKRAAVEKAFNEYASRRIYVESKTNSSAILVLGKFQKPSNEVPQNSFGFQVSVLQRATLDPIFNRYYYMQRDQWWNKYEQMYADMHKGLAAYNNSDYLVILATFGMQGVQYPTNAFYQFMLSAGAGAGIKGWEKVFDRGGCSNYVGLNYILVGIPTRGPGSGYEALTSGKQYPATAENAYLQILARKVQDTATHELQFLGANQE